MKPRCFLIVCLTLLLAAAAQAHVGSPDVFFDGMAGPWPVRVTVRMPGVVPGRAEIFVQVRSQDPASVTIVPLASGIAASNAPPAETARPVPGEPNLFTGDLWLMTVGAYSIEVRIRGKSGEGTVQVPVDSIARRQLPLPPWLGQILAALGLLLVAGAIAIVAAAAGESALPPEASPGRRERRQYWTAATVTGVVLALALVGGKKWWHAEEQDFRSHLLAGGWPDLEGEARVSGAQRILRLTLGKRDLGPKDNFHLASDHGKLLHLFLVGRPPLQAFAHLHPVREGNTTSFDVVLPPLPEGDYEMFCDMTLSGGFSSTATNMVHLPPIRAASLASSAADSLKADPDDSWVLDSAAASPEKSGGGVSCLLPGGCQIVWQAHSALRANQDAALRFQVRDQAGRPLKLEPYMGMMSHAAVMRSDGQVFAHLHPTGNYSMAAQTVFDKKLRQETGAAAGENGADGFKPDEWCGPAPAGGGASVISLPYEFPAAGDYRVWVQVKTGGQVRTAAFDALVDR